MVGADLEGSARHEKYAHTGAAARLALRLIVSDEGHHQGWEVVHG